jgi:mRNA interferase RelE/StbE
VVHFSLDKSNQILNEEEVMVWSVGKREDRVVYISAYKRILEKGQ